MKLSSTAQLSREIDPHGQRLTQPAASLRKTNGFGPGFVRFIALCCRASDVKFSKCRASIQKAAIPDRPVPSRTFATRWGFLPIS